jgi:hypothetical protein
LRGPRPARLPEFSFAPFSPPIARSLPVFNARPVPHEDDHAQKFRQFATFARQIAREKDVGEVHQKRPVSPARRKGLRQRPIELYFWPTSNGLKISIMLEECALPYELKPININRGEQFEPRFLSISPNNPDSGDRGPRRPGGKPVSIFESGAILQYLGRKTGSSILRASGSASKSKNGCFGRWVVWGQWRARRITSGRCSGADPLRHRALHRRGEQTL